MITLLIILAVFTIAGFLFIQQASFGKKPAGKRLERILQSNNYKDGSFKNLSETPMMAEDASYIRLAGYYINRENPTAPSDTLPSVKANFTIEGNKPVVTWFGHSTFLIQTEGKNILVDPVFSQRASPVSYAGSKAYPTSTTYALEDLPGIDLVVITHDHYDHLDYASIVGLKDKAKKFISPLGVGAHLEYWGVDPVKITELDWWEVSQPDTELKIAATPARHFSGRGIFDRNITLWASYVLQTSKHSIYIGGDSGYDTHFKEIGEKYGPFDLVFLESGQYHEFWKYIHMMPEETVQATADLRGKVLLPVHWGKFTLALHTWDDPIKRVMKKAEELNVKVTTPIIGEAVIIDSIYPDKQWWIR